MWMPHVGLIPWPDERIDQELIRKSEQDKSERYFHVGFQLENCDTRGVNDSTVALRKDESRNLNDEHGSLLIQLLLIKNKHDRLAKIDSRLIRDSYYNALRDSYNIVTSYLLSIQSFQSGANLAIWAIVIWDEKHRAKWVCKPQHASSDPLQLPEIIGMENEFKALFALYRDAKNNPSSYYRFFCYYKILEAFYEGSTLREIDSIIRGKGLSIKRPKRKITRDDLSRALIFGESKYLDMPYGEFFKELRSNKRLGVAHTFPRGKPFVNVDDFDLFSEYCRIGNLGDLVSRQLLLDELALHLQLLNAGVFSMPKPFDRKGNSETNHGVKNYGKLQAE